MTMMDTNNTICSDDLDIFILELNNILGEGKFTIRELIQEAGKRGLKKYWKNIKTIDDVYLGLTGHAIKDCVGKFWNMRFSEICPIMTQIPT